MAVQEQTASLELKNTAPESSLPTELFLCDQVNDSSSFVIHALPVIELLNSEQLALSVYHGWKSGNLELVKSAILKHHQTRDIDPEILDFLTCHELRVKGQIKESFKLLEKIQSSSELLIVKYRYTAEFIEFGSLDQAFKLMEEIIDKIPLPRRRVIELNYGIAANNQSNFQAVEMVLSRFKSSQDELSKLFYYWLNAAFLEQKGQSESSLQAYKTAVSLAASMPSRATDLGIIAYGQLRMAFWTGDLLASEEAFAIIDHDAKAKKAGVGIVRYEISLAIHEIMLGNILRAQKRLEILYQDEHWNRDYLQGAFVYLWAQMATGHFTNIKSFIAKLNGLRAQLSQSADIFDFTLFEHFFAFVAGDITADQASHEIFKFRMARSHRPQEFHFHWTDGLLLLLQEDPFEKLKAVSHFAPYPILQRITVWMLVRQGQLNMTMHWRFILNQTKDAIAHSLANYRSAQLNKDIVEFVRAVKQLHKQNALNWLRTLDCDGSEFVYEAAGLIPGNNFLADHINHRVISIKTAETLDTQPQLSELLLAFVKNPGPLDKEQISQALGHPSYDPIQHDALIYNHLTRLRDWLTKHDISATIISTGDGWKINFSDRVVQIGNKVRCSPPKTDLENFTSSPRLVAKLENKEFIHPRHEWILNSIQTHGFVTRKQFMQQFAVQKSTAANDFNSLISLGLIERKGSGRGIYYRLKREIS